MNELSKQHTLSILCYLHFDRLITCKMSPRDWGYADDREASNKSRDAAISPEKKTVLNG